MTLCGVLKDILLVGASVAIWATPISGLQAFGYSIALVGLIYYKLGAAQMKSAVSDSRRSWAEFGQKHPIMKKLIIFGSVLLLILVVMFFSAPSVGYDPKQITSMMKEHAKVNKKKKGN